MASNPFNPALPEGTQIFPDLAAVVAQLTA